MVAGDAGSVVAQFTKGGGPAMSSTLCARTGQSQPINNEFTPSASCAIHTRVYCKLRSCICHIHHKNWMKNIKFYRSSYTARSIRSVHLIQF